MITAKQLQQLKATGKIRGYRKTAGAKVPAKKSIEPKKKHTSPAKEATFRILADFCRANGLKFSEEHVFHPTRKWRFDWVIENSTLAIEFEGGVTMHKGAHNSIKMLTKDCEKYNAAALLGWQVLRYNAKNFKDLFNDLQLWAHK